MDIVCAGLSNEVLYEHVTQVAPEIGKVEDFKFCLIKRTFLHFQLRPFVAPEPI